MALMLAVKRLAPGLTSLPVTISFQAVRTARYEAFDSGVDPEELAEARKWYGSFSTDSLPLGTTTFSRSSGPGGQHVNKTESKATTSWPLKSLLPTLPVILHAGIRASKYYTSRMDALSFQAQESRSRTANAEDNRAKLAEEVLRVYGQTVPGETRSDKSKKFAAVENKFHNKRMDDKKSRSSKKQSRRGPSD